MFLVFSVSNESDLIFGTVRVSQIYFVPLGEEIEFAPIM